MGKEQEFNSESVRFELRWDLQREKTTSKQIMGSGAKFRIKKYI